MIQKTTAFILIVGLMLSILTGCAGENPQTTNESTGQTTAATDSETTTSVSQSEVTVPTTTPATDSETTTSVSQSEATVPTTTPATEPAGTDGTYGNGGIVVEQGDWLYFNIGGEESGFYKVRQDGSDLTKLYDRAAHYFYIIGDWIYLTDCTHIEDGTPISVDLLKMKTNGKHLIKLLTMKDKDIIFMQLEGGWIYFSTEQSENLQSGQYPCNVYRIKTDGTGSEIFIENVFMRALQDGWIYALDIPGIFRIQLDGTQRQTIDEKVSDYYYHVDRGWIYFINDTEGFRLYKIKTDGSGKTMLSDDPIQCCYMDKGEIYYQVSTAEEGLEENINKVFKMHTDGSGRTEIKIPGGIHLVGAVNGWLYLMEDEHVENSATEDLPGGYIKITFYRMKTDGSSRMDLVTYLKQNAG